MAITSLKTLYKELLDDKCVIFASPDGDLQRSISVVTFEITDFDERILVQVGRWKDTKDFDARRRKLPKSKKSADDTFSLLH